MGNPFKDQSSALYQLDTKYVMIRESVDSLQRIEGLRIPLRERIIIMLNKPLTDTIVKNKINIFALASKLSNNKKNNHIATLKFNCSLFARMYISYQAGNRDLD